MGKKISPASLMKISKNHHHHHHEKKQLNSLLKVLRPKVYITDPSSFKSLVQQLTGLEGGNGTTAIDNSSSPPPQTQLDHHNISILDIDQEDHGHEHHHHLPHDESNSLEVATSPGYASVDSFEHVITSCNLPVSFTEEVDQLASDQMCLLDNEIISEYLWMNQQQDNQDIDSWLLDMEPCPNISYNGCYPQMQQAVSIYDYDLPGII